jgi:predicted metal-dependent phosphoesterase TrpH
MSRTERPEERASHLRLVGKDGPEATPLHHRALHEHHDHLDSRARFGLADIHMHTNASDGMPTPQELLDHVEQRTNLDVIAITDHDTLEGALRARDLVEAGDYRFQLIVGEEVSTREGHLLGLFLEKRIAPGLSIERSIDLIHEQGGLAIVAHPFHRMFRFSVQRKVMDRLVRQPHVHPDGIETLNGSFAGIGANRVAMTLSRRVYRWAETGGSDAHTLTAIGCARTRFAGVSAEELRAALAQRDTQPAGGLWAAREYMAYARHVVRTRAAGSRALGEHSYGSEHEGLSRAAAHAHQRA